MKFEPRAPPRTSASTVPLPAQQPHTHDCNAPQYAVPGQPGISSTVPELANVIMHESHAHGFDERFVEELCAACSMHERHALQHQAPCEWFLNMEVAPCTAVCEGKLRALGRYVSAQTGLWVQVHVMQSHTTAVNKVQVCG